VSVWRASCADTRFVSSRSTTAIDAETAARAVLAGIATAVPKTADGVVGRGRRGSVFEPRNNARATQAVVASFHTS